MVSRTNIPVYIDGEDKKKIEEASKIVALNQSSFCRTSAIKEANRILKEKEGETNGSGV